jgi:hypothetical protein
MADRFDKLITALRTAVDKPLDLVIDNVYL